MPEKPERPPGVAEAVKPILKEIDQRDAHEERKRVGQVYQGRNTCNQCPGPLCVMADKMEAEEETLSHGSADSTGQTQTHIQHQRDDHSEQEEGDDLSPRQPLGN